MPQTGLNWLQAESQFRESMNCQPNRSERRSFEAGVRSFQDGCVAKPYGSSLTLGLVGVSFLEAFNG
jgi:hypothetical protein